MTKICPYNRGKAVAYALEWAMSRNPAYLDFEELGGDCTNFASQCLLAGGGVMNITAVFGWYYITSWERTASWTGARFLHRFLTSNNGSGPFASVAPLSEAQPGDLIQLQNEEGISYHTLVVTGRDKRGLLVSGHSRDVCQMPLSAYVAPKVCCLQIQGVRHCSAEE